jgi:hypothetical protein
LQGVTVWREAAASTWAKLENEALSASCISFLLNKSCRIGKLDREHQPNSNLCQPTSKPLDPPQAHSIAAAF